MLRPHLPDEEVIEYEVYLEAGSDADAEAARMTSWVQQLCPFLSSYIWQRDAFALSAQSDEDKNGEDAKKSVCVCGRTRFGDNVSDEWLVVFLVRELSRAFPSCVFRVCDGDGELLLVEAALALPDWVEPDTAQGRVFFFRGEMQLLGVPEEEENEEQPYAPAHVRSVAHAAEIVRRFGPLGLTRASDAVQQCIENRLAEMPQKALIENYHWCRLRLPRELARLLQYRPQIVARAVEAFYYREAEDDARLRNLNRFDVSSSVVVRVRFSRFLFVQLLQQTFPIPSARFSLPAENDPLRKAFELGMKLTCGFELLWSNDAGREELQHDLEKLSGTELLVGGKDASEPDSDESWMLISPEELDDMMAPREAEVEQVKQMMDKVEGIKVLRLCWIVFVTHLCFSKKKKKKKKKSLF